MFKVENDMIWLTRGDTAEFRPIIEGYEAQEGDKVVFSMKKALNDDEPILKIETDLGENIVFTNESTNKLPSGSYVYDLRINTVDGNISTFVNGEILYLLGDVDNARD